MLSVLLLTRDRRRLLQRCLDSLGAQRGIRGDWEIVVIDTGSRDGSRTLLDAWVADAPRGAGAGAGAIHDAASAAPHRRWHPFDAAGGGAFSRARTLAIDSARGDRLLFTDDDCWLPPDWVARGDAALATHDAVGGVVLAANQLPFRGWWDPELAWLAALSAPGCFDARFAGTIFYPQTANLALRRDALPAVPFVSVVSDFGAAGGIYTNEREDSTLWRRLRLDGRRVAVDPAWIALHHTPPQRASLGTLLTRAWRDGRAEAAQRFNRGAAQQAAAAVGEGIGGALAGIVRPGRRVVPPLAWAVREAGHVVRYAALAPFKFSRTLLAPLARGVARIPLEQARSVVGDWYRTRALAAPVPPAPPRAPRCVVLFADAYLGDMVLLEPVLRALRAQDDPPRVVLVTNDRFGLKLYASSPYVDVLVAATRRARAATLRKAILAERPDIALLAYWHHLPPRLLFDLADGLPLVGFDADNGLKRGSDRARLTHRLAKDRRLHEIDNLARLLQWGGLRGAPQPFDFAAVDAARDEEQIPRGAIMLHWGSVRAGKRWSPERWADVALALRERTGAPLVVTGAPGEAAEIDTLLRFFAIPATNIARLACNGVPQALSAFRRAALMITTCSGPKHLAIAAGVPTVTLYGESDPARWGAYFDRDRHIALGHLPPDLMPSELAGLPPNHAMLSIGVDEVVAAAERLYTAGRR